MITETSKELLSGKTNARGEFSFKIPRKTAMKLVLKAGTGHRGEWTIPLSEIDPQTSGSEPEPFRPSVTLDQKRQALDRSLERRLSPVLKKLAEAQDKAPDFRDILGGIAAILNRLNIGYVIVSHEYDFLAETTRQICSMNEGKIHYDGGSDTLNVHFHKHHLKKHPHRL